MAGDHHHARNIGQHIGDLVDQGDELGLQEGRIGREQGLLADADHQLAAELLHLDLLGFNLALELLLQFLLGDSGPILLLGLVRP
ncbi:hypothetical protein D3C86_1831710 [compost metagenome]